jgi:hypothetical protein
MIFNWQGRRAKIRIIWAKYINKVAQFKKNTNFAPGEMAEWSIAAVLKTVEGQTSGGSNPSLSADRNIKKTQEASSPFSNNT